MISLAGPVDPVSILSHLPIALMVLDSGSGGVLMVNDKFSDLFGYSQSELKHERDWWPVAFPEKSYRDFVSKEWEIRVDWARENDCEMEPMEAVVRCKNGMDCSIRTHLVNHKGLDIITLVDISDQKVLQKKYEMLAATDALTGLSNRRAFFSVLEQHLSLANRYSRPLSIILADIDHFKGVNDSFGHQAGDAVLAHFARLMKNTLRTSDIAARIGGEEFALLLPETASQGAYCLAERLRSAVVENVCYHAGDPIHLTVSFGLACLSGESHSGAPSCDEFMHLADDALYCAKREGRNRVNMLEFRAV
jgi:diguanylate cyclase (GGDEF)-like protein